MIVACVRTGDKYPVSYVHRLRDMVARHLPREHKFICFTDQPKELRASGVVAIDIKEYNLKSWWGKMMLFSHGWREGHKVLYFDLDTVIVGDLLPLSEVMVDFAICANFTRAAGNLDWPCKYGSCVMVLGSGFDGSVFQEFWTYRYSMMDKAGRYGDQKAIEELIPDAVLLQSILPEGYFMGYRELEDHKREKPEACSLVIFAGNSKPHNTSVGWVRRAWERST